MTLPYATIYAYQIEPNRPINPRDVEQYMVSVKHNLINLLVDNALQRGVIGFSALPDHTFGGVEVTRHRAVLRVVNPEANTAEWPAETRYPWSWAKDLVDSVVPEDMVELRWKLVEVVEKALVEALQAKPIIARRQEFVSPDIARTS